MRYILILIGLCLTLSVKADIPNIPQHDIQKIKSLFGDLILEHNFAYTIFGSKPMSLADHSLEVPPDLPIHRQLRARLLLMKPKASLKAWYKHKNEFDFKDFIFLDKEEDLFPCLVLILINKKNLLQVLHNHESIFREELGDTFTPESFLDKIEKRETSFAQAIHKNYRLLGIMLGYGVRNATLFQERWNLQREIIIRKREGLPQDNTLAQKLQTVESQFGDFSEFEEDAIIPPLYFLADVSHPETIELKRQYESDRQTIVELRKKPKFMDRVLNRLVTSD